MAGADPVTAIFNAIASVSDSVRPFIEESFAQKYENEHRERIEKWNKYQAIEDTKTRADLEWNFIVQLLADAKSASASAGRGSLVAIPSDTVAALVQIVSEKIKQDALLARIQFKK